MFIIVTKIEIVYHERNRKSQKRQVKIFSKCLSQVSFCLLRKNIMWVPYTIGKYIDNIKISNGGAYRKSVGSILVIK